MAREMGETGFQQELGLQQVVPSLPLILRVKGGRQVQVQESYTCSSCVHTGVRRGGVAVGGVTLRQSNLHAFSQARAQFWRNLGNEVFLSTGAVV